jgi:ubiquinone/menaquinone biosynthesis C-methylase UbiE
MAKTATARRIWPFHRRKVAIIETSTQPLAPPPIPERDPLAPAPPANPVSAFWSSGRVPANVNEWLDRVAKMQQVGKERSFQVLNLSQGNSVLDIGCGNGRDVARLMEIVGSSGEVWGVDNSSQLIHSARAAYPRAKFMEGDIFKLPFKDHFFDAVRAERVLLHTGDVERALAEMRRVTKIGGMISTFEPIEGSWYPGNLDLHERVFNYVSGKFFKAGRAGYDAYISMMKMGLDPNVECYPGVITADFIRFDMTRPAASSLSSLFKPATVQLAINAGIITEAEGEEYQADFQRGVEENTFLMFHPVLLAYAQIR